MLLSTLVNICIIVYKEINYGTVQIISKHCKMYFLDKSKAKLLLNIQRETLELKNNLLEVEKKKLDVLKEICVELKRKKLLLFLFFSNS